MIALASQPPIRSIPVPLGEYSGKQPELRLIAAVLEDALTIITAGVRFSNPPASRAFRRDCGVDLLGRRRLAVFLP